MKSLYILKQIVNREWDTYDSAIVVASSIEDARYIHPDGVDVRQDNAWFNPACWCAPEDVEIMWVADLPENSIYEIGEVVVASFNAG